MSVSHLAKARPTSSLPSTVTVLRTRSPSRSRGTTPASRTWRPTAEVRAWPTGACHVSEDAAMSAHPDRDGSTDGVIVIDHLVKNFGSVHAVDDLSFTVRPGRVTGFLGPNGAGKTTTLRILLGLVSPTAGTATIGGSTYGHFVQPMRSVGAALEAANIHPGRSALDHLRVYAPQVVERA